MQVNCTMVDKTVSYDLDTLLDGIRANVAQLTTIKGGSVAPPDSTFDKKAKIWCDLA